MTATGNTTNEHVILLHGLGRTRFSLSKLANTLNAEGYAVVNRSYPSQRATIAALAEQVLPPSLQACQAADASRIHFVTHSMGGILLRYYLQQHRIERLGCCVMLAPPNQGSEVAERLQSYRWYRWFNGPAGMQLGTGSASVPLQLHRADFPLGIIAGNQAAFWDRFFAAMIPGANDGKVAVEGTKLEGMCDFLQLPCNHTAIMNDPEVIKQILHFLKFTQFQH